MPRPNQILLTCRPFVVLCVVAKPLHTNGGAIFKILPSSAYRWFGYHVD